MDGSRRDGANDGGTEHAGVIPREHNFAADVLSALTNLEHAIASVDLLE